MWVCVGVYVTPPPLTQITVNTNITDLSEFLEHLLRSTNMKCLTPKQVHSYSHSHIPTLAFLPLGVYHSHDSIPIIPFPCFHSEYSIPHSHASILSIHSSISHTFIPSITFPHSNVFIPSIPIPHSHTSIHPFPCFHSSIFILPFPHSQALTGECGFLAANLYAKSVFGEDALANLSIEKPVGGAEGGASNTTVQGHIRIRAKTQVG